MTKYIVNDTVHGYDKVTLHDSTVIEGSDNLVVIIVDKNCDTHINEYYKAINQMLKKHNRVILVGIDDNNKIFTILASLLITFNNYDIYKLADRNLLTADFLNKLEQRHPDYSEVEQFIGGNETAYSELGNILYGIESLVNEGNLDSLRSFIESNMITIESMSATLNYMKKTCDIFNSGELIDELNKLKTKFDDKVSEITELNKQIEDTKLARDKYKAESENLNIKLNTLKEDNTQLKIENESAGSVITAYKTLNTQVVTQCRVKKILYFKEISEIPYIKSMISVLKTILERKFSKKVKLLIYDSTSGMYDNYSPLRIVSGKEFAAERDTLVRKTPEFVVAEPNQAIIDAVISSEECFDVVIIYDKLRGLHDIIEGNIVTKFFVINSRQDYLNVKRNNHIKIKDMAYVITHENSSMAKDKDIENEFLDIPTIPDYTQSTDSAKVTKYTRLKTQVSKKVLIDEIIKISNAI